MRIVATKASINATTIAWLVVMLSLTISISTGTADPLGIFVQAAFVTTSPPLAAAPLLTRPSSWPGGGCSSCRGTRTPAPSSVVQRRRFALPSSSSEEDEDNKDNESEAERMKRQAEELRAQIRQMEDQLGEKRKQRAPPPSDDGDKDAFAGTSSRTNGPTLDGKKVLVTGANGRLGSMVCRYLLRNYPRTQVVACVHVVGENSPTARGYGRLSYEVGAEDGIGTLGAAWSSEDRTATFEYDPQVMSGYNLRNLRIVECELLDPIQCQSIVDDSQCDAVIWCATDYNGNRPRAVSGLNIAFLFRAAANPTKGRVEVEGLQNMLGAFKLAQQKRNYQSPTSTAAFDGSSTSPKKNSNDPINFVLVSTAPEALEDFETPFGSFMGVKRQGEQMLMKDFPSITSTVLQLARFDDNFVEEGLEIQTQINQVQLPKVLANTNDEESNATDEESAASASAAASARKRSAFRKINRRDAAKAVSDALLMKEDYTGKVVQVWTSPTVPSSE